MTHDAGANKILLFVKREETDSRCPNGLFVTLQIILYNSPEDQIDDTRLIGYLQSLLDEGCLMSITKDVIDYMSSEASKKDSDSKQRMYLMWDDLLGKVDNFPDKQKAVFIQAVSEVFALFEDEARNIDKGILHILTTNILLLRKQKIEMFIDASGCLSFSLVNIESEELEDK